MFVCTYQCNSSGAAPLFRIAPYACEFKNITNLFVAKRQCITASQRRKSNNIKVTYNNPHPRLYSAILKIFDDERGDSSRVHATDTSILQEIALWPFVTTRC